MIISNHSENKFYNASHPFDGGGALAVEIQKIGRQLAQMPASDPNREPLLRRAEALRDELSEVMGPVLNKCLHRFGAEDPSDRRGWTEREKLAQAGRAAILRAVDTFDPAADGAFDAVAYQCASRAMREEDRARQATAV